MAKGAEFPNLQNTMNNGIASASEGTFTGAGATPVFQNYDYLINKGIQEGSARRFDIGAYENIIGKGKVNPNLDISILDETRAQNQSTGRLIGSALGQTLTTIVGGAITGIGSLLNMGEATIASIENIWDKNAKYKWDKIINDGLSGFFTKTGKGIEDFGRTSMPIYQTQQAQKGGFSGGMGDATWWASMFPTIGSAAASIIPMIGAMKGLQLAGKLGMAVNGLSKTGRAFNKLGKFLYNPVTQQTFGTLYGAHLDSMEEIVRGYDEQFQYAKNLGYSDDEAKRFASVYASEAYKDAWAYGILFNAIELNALLKGVKNAPINTVKIEKGLQANIEGLAKKGKNYVLDSNIPELTTSVFIKNAAAKIGDFAKISLSEGLEEMRVDVALNEGTLAAKKDFGISDINENSTFFNRLAQFVSQGKSWDSFIWGAIGGGVMAGGRGLINKVLNGKAIQEYDTRRAANILQGIQDLTNEITDFNGDMEMNISSEKELDDNGQPILDKNGNIKTKYTIQDPMTDLMVSLMKTIGTTNGFEYANEFLKQVSSLTDEELTNIYGENKRSTVDTISRELKIMRDIYGKNIGLTWGSPFDDVLKIQASTEDYLLDYYKRRAGIIDTKIKVLYNEPETRKNEIINRLKTLDPKLHSIITDTTNYTDKRDKLNSDNNDKLKNTVKLEKDLKRLTNNKTKYLDEIKHYEDAISELESKIASSKEKIEQNAYDGVQLNLFDTDKYNIEKQSIDSNYSEIKKLNTKIIKLKNKLSEIEFKKSAINSQIEDNKDIIESNNKTIDKYNQILNDLQFKFNKEQEREDNNIAEYKRIEKELNDIKFNNEEYQALSVLLEQVNTAIEIIDSRIKNRDFIMKSHAKKLEEIQKASDKAEEDIKNNEDNLKTTNEKINTEQESQVEPTVKTETDSMGISYSLDVSNRVNSVSFNNKVYSVGSKFNLVGSPKTIQKLDVFSDADMDAVQVTITDDETNKEETIPAFQLAEQEITDYIEPKPKKEQTIFETLNKIINDPNKNIINLGFHNAIEILSSAINDATNEYYKALFSITNDPNIINLRIHYISNIIKFLNDNIAFDSSKETIKLKTDIVDKLENIIIQYNVKHKIKLLTDYFKTFNPKPSLALTQEQNNTISKIYDSIDEELAIELSDDIIIENNEIKIINPNLLFDDIRTSLINKLNVATNKQTGVILNYLNDENLGYINDIIFNLKNKFRPTFINQVQRFKSLKDGYYRTLNDILSDTKKSENKIINQDEDVIKKIKEVLKFNDTVEELYNQSIIHGLRPDNNLINKYNEQREKVEDWIGKTSQTINISNSDLINALNNSKVFLLLNTTNAIANNIFSYYELSNKETETSTSDTIQSLPEFLGSISIFDDFTGEDEDKLAYSPNEINYYISDNIYKGLKATINVISELNAKNIYLNTHKYTFDDILDIIYQEPNGRELVLDNYTNIWNALIYFKNDLHPERLLDQMRGKVPDETVDKLKYIFDILNKQIINPKTSTDFKYIIGDYNINSNYIKDFFKYHIQREYNYVNHVGLRRITPSLYDELFNEINYDTKTNTLNDTVIVNGIKWNTKELFNILEDIHDGQEFTAIKVNDEIHIISEINGKQLLIEKINPKDSDTYGGFPLGRINTSGELVYHSAFGSEYGLSNMALTVAKYLGENKTVFDLFKEFYKIGYTANLKKQFNNDSIKEKLYNILRQIDDIHFVEDTVHNELINALFKTQQFNTDIEELTSEKLDIESIDLEKAYKFIAPAFYGYRLANIDDMPHNKYNIYNRYINLNNKLAQDFSETQKLNNEFKTKKEVTLKLTHINKTPIGFAQSRNYAGRLIDNIKSINGSIQLFNHQLGPDFQIVYSNLSENKFEDDNYIRSELIKQVNKGQIFTEIKQNGNANGKTILPVRRSNINSGLNEEYDRAAMYGVTKQITRLAETALLTHNSSKQNSKLEYIENPTIRNQFNSQYADVLDYLSDIIIPEVTKNYLGTKWFNVSALFKDKYGYSKTIKFNTSIRSKYTITTGVPYTNTLKIKYNKVNNSYIPTEIEIYRNRIPEKHKFDKSGKLILGKQKSPFTNSEINLLHGTLVSATSTYGEFVKIPINKSQTVNDVLNSNAFQKLFGGMLRSVNTTWVGNHYELGIVKAPADFNIPQGDFTPQYLIDAKNAGIIKSTTQITFKNLYQFHLLTNSLTTTIRPIKTQSGTIVSNTDPNVSPAMFFEIKTNDKEITQEIKDDNNKYNALNILKSITNTKDNWFAELKEKYNTTEEVLKALNVITNDTNKTNRESLINLYDTIYDTEKVDLIIDEFDDKHKAYQGYVEYDTKLKREVIHLNTNYLNSLSTDINDIRNLINHESLHVFFDFENIKSELHNTLKDIINPIIDRLNTSTQEEFNNTYKSNFTPEEFNTLKLGFSIIENQPREITTLIFTNKQFAPLANRIIITDETTKTKNTLWNKILNALLHILGIKIKKGSLTDVIKRTIVNEINTNNGIIETTNNAASGRLTLPPTGKAERSDASAITQNNQENDLPIFNESNKIKDMLNDFMDDNLELQSADFDLLQSSNFTAGRGLGVAPTSISSANTLSDILKIDKNDISLTNKYQLDFINKYIDDNNNKIC